MVDLLNLTARVVSAHVAHNRVPTEDVPTLIREVHRALANTGQAETAAPRGEPAVPIKKSVQPDSIVCLEDGKKFKSLKRHLRTVYDLTPDQYRAKWGLPADYPMVAPNYAAARSELAKQMGLGARRRRPDETEAEAVQPAAPQKGRRKKAA